MATVSATEHPTAYVRRMLVNRHLATGRTRRVTEVLTPTPRPRREADQLQAADQLGEHDAMWQALTQLTARQRAVLVLRYYEGLDDQAIADVIGCRRVTVRSLAMRGLAVLRDDPTLSASEPDEPARRTT